MKILNVISYWGHEYGGPFINTANLTAALIEKGHEVTVVATCRKPVDRSVVTHWSYGEKSAPIKVHFFDRKDDFIFYSPDFKHYCAKELKKFDLVLIHGFWRYPLSCAAHFSRIYKVPYCLFTHGMLSQWSLSQSRLKKAVYLYASAKKDIERSRAVFYMRQDELAALSGSSRNNLFFRNALHPQHILSLRDSHVSYLSQKSGEKVNLLYLSRIHPKKGLDVLVRAMKGVVQKYPHVYLTIAGPTEDKKYLEQILHQVKLDQIEPHIRLAGTVSGKTKQDLLAQSDIFVLPTEDDCMPLALLEAMAAGLPVVTTPGADIPEIHQAMGLVVRKDVMAVQEALLGLIGKKEKWGAMGKFGHEYVLEKFNWEERSEELDLTLEGFVCG